ncbi:hypothetical protein OF83DRAFT_1288093 [Amylostereum chailletii]|nr:hypothetical protein OF83DRAFT_1288093 [Amylostereum chailletii]
MILEFSSFELILSAVVVAMKVLRRVSPANNIKIAEAVRERSLELYRRFAPQYAVLRGDALVQAKLVQVKTLEDIAMGARSPSQRYMSARAYLREAKELHEVVKYCLRETTPGDSGQYPSNSYRISGHYAYPADSRGRQAAPPSPVWTAIVRMEQELVDMIAATLHITDMCIELARLQPASS